MLPFAFFHQFNNLIKIVNVNSGFYSCIIYFKQMLRKSVETRDWLHSLEPRTVRAVMKRVMEEMAAVETQVS